MGDWLTADKLGLVLFFVVPGLIVLYVRNQFVSNRKPPLSEAVFAYVVVSLTYQAIVYPMSAAVFGSTLQSEAHPLAWFAFLFLGPAFVGLLLGLNARAGWARGLLSKIGIHLGHPVDSAWDWRFAGCDPCWILVVLKDGTRWAGHLGDGSFMSTDRAERDLCIGSVYAIDENDVWTPKGSSVWIAHGEIQTLEFWPISKETANVE